MHQLLSAPTTAPLTLPWWFTAGATLLALVGPLGSLLRTFAHASEKRHLERVQGFKEVLSELETVGAPKGPDASSTASARHRALLESTQEELRLAATAYVQSAQWRPGSFFGGLLMAIYGCGLVVTSVAIGVSFSWSAPTSLLIAGFVFSGGAIVLVTGIRSMRRRLLTRAFRTASGLRDPLTFLSIREQLATPDPFLRRVTRAYLQFITQ